MTQNEWLQHEAKRQQAGLTKRGYCRQEGIKIHKYQYYRNKYDSKIPTEPKLAEIIVEQPSSFKDFSITIQLTEQGEIKFSGHARNLALFQKKLSSLSHSYVRLSYYCPLGDQLFKFIRPSLFQGHLIRLVILNLSEASGGLR